MERLMVDDDFDPDEIETYADENDDGYVRVRKTDLTKVRKAARGKSTLTKAERDELDALRTEKVVRDADLGGLTARQVAVVAREAGDDRSPQALRQIAEELGFIEPAAPSAEQQATDTEIDAHAEAVAVTSGAPASTHQTTVTAGDVAGWGVDKRMRLLDQHPDLHERLLREEPVVLPPSFT